jgi:ankyrin repeat protein
VATMELLLARGVPRDAGELGRTAFQVAASEGKVESLKFLLAKGAKVDYTIPQMSDGSALHLATFYGHLDAVRLLVESGANVNKAETGRGRTPLHQIADHGNFDGKRRDIAVLLLDKGANIDARDSEGKTPLALALENRNDGAVKLLRERGAKE